MAEHEIRFSAAEDAASFANLKRSLRELSTLANEVANAFSRITMGPTGAGTGSARPGTVAPGTVGGVSSGPLSAFIRDARSAASVVRDLRMEVGRGGTSPLDLTGGRGRGTVSPLDRPMPIGTSTGTGARYSSLEAHTVNIQANEVKITANTATLTGAAADRESTVGTGVAPHRDAGGGGRGGDGDGSDSADDEESAPTPSPDRTEERQKRIRGYLFRMNMGMGVVNAGFSAYDFYQRSNILDAEMQKYTQFSGLRQQTRAAGLQNQLFFESARGDMSSIMAASALTRGGSMADLQSLYGMQSAEEQKLQAQKLQGTAKMVGSFPSAIAAGLGAAGGTYLTSLGLAALGVLGGPVGWVGLGVAGLAGGTAAFAGGSYLSGKAEQMKAQADLASGAPTALAIQNTIEALNLEKEGGRKPLYSAVQSYGANAESTLASERVMARLGLGTGTSPLIQMGALGLQKGVSFGASQGVASSLAMNRLFNSASEAKNVAEQTFSLIRGGYSESGISAAEQVSQFLSFSGGQTLSPLAAMNIAAGVSGNQLMQEKLMGVAGESLVGRTGVLRESGLSNLMQMYGAAGAGDSPVGLQLTRMGIGGFQQAGASQPNMMLKIERLKAKFGDLTPTQLMYLSKLGPADFANVQGLASVLGIEPSKATQIANYAKGLDADISIRMALPKTSGVFAALGGKTIPQAFGSLGADLQKEITSTAAMYGIVGGGTESAARALRALGSETTEKATTGAAKTEEAGTDAASKLVIKKAAAEVFGMSAAQAALGDLAGVLTTTVQNINGIAQQLAWQGKYATEQNLSSLGQTR